MDLITKENVLRAVLVATALKQPAIPLLDAPPVMSEGLGKEVLQVVKGLRNGMWYGAKIRFVHSVVMAILFSKGTLSGEIVKTLRNSWTHAKNLGSFVFIFKALLLLLKKVSGGQRASWHSAIAGLLGGSVIWSTNDPITVQINLYLMSRILFGAVKQGASGVDYNPTPADVATNYKVFGSVIWMCVMYQFYNHPLKLQASLTKSMEEIYLQSDIIGKVK
eukprot:TRINITY_DN17751_c1_g1_i1.p1 TRINITY_DN17751_c1_g1~~TRINITY_DN17751_c1_g1_i1.p1  ORF type:complete len:235 (+),score=52.35 TRINITY_DN17751_c1_g1_i1:47-706(+)